MNELERYNEKFTALKRLVWSIIMLWMIVVSIFLLWVAFGRKEKPIKHIWFGGKIEQVAQLGDGDYRIISKKGVFVVSGNYAKSKEIKE